MTEPKEEGTILANISIAKQALAQARDFADILKIRDQAVAMQAYASARGADELAMMAVEVKLRAERKAGEFLAYMKEEGILSKGGRPTETSNNMLPVSPTLQSLGVEKIESHRWQSLASIPEEEFEKDFLDKAKKKTQSGFLIMAARYNVPDPVETPPFPENKYRCIVVDPPWPMEKSERTERPNQGKHFDYPVMTVEEIMELPIGDLADSNNGCQIYLWTTNRFLPDAFKVFEHWGVTYNILLVWVKPTGMVPFGWMRNAEFVLFGYIGPFEIKQMGLKQVFEADSGRHSEKPDEFYELVLKASPAKDGERLDMFARRPRPGFEPWGAE
jgi:N6-adenosine-specific RNA methylase IME4